MVQSRDGEWRFPPLAGVLTCPTLRPDGSLLDRPGYDAETRLLLIDPPAMPAIPEEPSREDAERALERLDRLLDEFPFVDDASRSVALSALITPVVRGAMPVVPAHITRASTSGTGKSYLNDLVGAITCGHICPVIAAGQNEEETEKRLVGKLLTGAPLVSIDNLNGEFSGDMLCQMIERPIVEVRPLGRSEIIRIESRCTVLATGNNLIPVGDVVRRILLCELDANVERPELRTFTGNPFATILADRGSYIAAVLTICRAYLVAGQPDKRPPLASFEEWSNMVRSALTWLGRADPVDTMEAAREDDPQTNTLRGLIAAWPDEPPLSVGDLVARANERDDGELRRPDLHEVLSTMAGGRGVIEPRTVAAALRRWKGRIVDGAKLDVDKLRKVPRWMVVGSTKSRGAGRRAQDARDESLI